MIRASGYKAANNIGYLKTMDDWKNAMNQSIRMIQNGRKKFWKFPRFEESHFLGYKFRQTEGQTAYILVDRLRNNGKGSVIGLLKVQRV